MKTRTILKLSVAAALVSASVAAHADLSIEQSQTYRQNGQTQTMTVGVKPSDFDPSEVAFKLFQSQNTPQWTIYGITPEKPASANMQLVIKAVQSYMPPVPFGAGGRYPIYPQVLTWAAWGVQAGWLDADYFGRVLGSCVAAHQSEFVGEHMPWAALPYSTTACAVSAYLQAYAMNPHGYTAGSMYGLVPLCEVTQQNDCNITGGTFDPWSIYREQQAKARAAARAAEQNAQAQAQDLHEQAVQRYNLIKAGDLAGLKRLADARAACQEAMSTAITQAINAGSQPDTAQIGANYRACLKKAGAAR